MVMLLFSLSSPNIRFRAGQGWIFSVQYLGSSASLLPKKSMVTPLPPLDPLNDTLLFSAGTVLLPLGPQKEPAKCQAEPPTNKWRVHPWAIVAVVGLCVLGVAIRRAESLPQPVEPVASIKATTSLGFVVKPARLPEPGAHDTRVAFVCSPAEAARLAAADRKLTFLVHVSGDFDDGEFT